MADPKSRELARHRFYATFLLVLMAAVFVYTETVEEPGFWVLLVRAGAEAAMVGGLADWFAVTALFRHPLRLPIPHTAVIPNNKDRIGQGLAAFIEQHFLDPDLVVARLRSASVAERAGRWLADPGRADAAARRILATVPFLLDSVDDREVQEFLRKVLHRRVTAVNLAQVLGTALGLLRDSDRHQEFFDFAIAHARRYLAENEERIYEMIQERSRWWLPSRIDRKVAEAIILGLNDLLFDLGRRDHDVRLRFDADIDRLIENLRTSPDYAAKVEGLREQLLNNDQVQSYLASFWQRLRRMIERDVAAADSTLRGSLARLLQSLGNALLNDPAMQERLNRRLEESAKALVMPWRAEIGRFIADVVRGWEARTIAERIELAVGKDLQYIRINGTVVGAIVGCAIFVVARAI